MHTRTTIYAQHYYNLKPVNQAKPAGQHNNYTPNTNKTNQSQTLTKTYTTQKPVSKAIKSKQSETQTRRIKTT